jgi:hypothetical protein
MMEEGWLFFNGKDYFTFSCLTIPERDGIGFMNAGVGQYRQPLGEAFEAAGIYGSNRTGV